MSGSTLIGRIAAFASLAIAAFAVVALLAGGGDDYEVTAQFENASQVVGGEQVVVAGHSVGSVTGIELGRSGAALITFTVDGDHSPLRRGTVATVRTFSLSGVANRQIQLTLPAEAEAGDEIPSGGTLTRAETVSAVDIDQFFDMLDEETIEDFKHVIQGFERSYEGVGREANRGFRYFNPFLSTARRLFDELTVDERALERLLVDTDRFSGALVERSGDITALVGNANRMMNAIGDRREHLAEAIRELPAFMRRSNTTFVNLRATLDDLTPLVRASTPAMRALRPFLPELRQLAGDAVPTFRDLTRIIRRPGPGNDLVELTRGQVPVRDIAIGTGFPDCGRFAAEAKRRQADPDLLDVAADGDFTQGAFGEAICSLANGHPQLEFLRAYTGELIGWMDTFSHSGFADAMGGVGRVSTTFNTWSFSPHGPAGITQELLGQILTTDPVPAEDRLELLNHPLTRRCPNAQERPPGAVDPDDASVPFTDRGHLTDGSLGSCDPTQLHAGP